MTTLASPRPATLADRDGLRALIARESLPAAGLDLAWAVWVVPGDGRHVLGGVALERHEDEAGVAYLLRSLVVTNDARGSGVGASLVRTALAAAAADGSAHAPVALLTETADDYFRRFGFHLAERAALPSALAASPELTGACPDSARAYLRLAAAP